jgi:glucan phosphoethanolaminetransferase (alkaline phosphatase superfamily)
MYGFQKPAPWWALLATTVLFLLPGLGVIGRWLYPLIPAPQGQYLVLGILGLLIIGFFIELFKARSFPRWGLPYAGFFLAIIFFYGLQYLVVAPLVTFWMPAVQPGDELGRLMSQALTSGYAWLFLLLCLGLVLLISAALPPLRGIARSARQDWTKLSFLLYGAVVLVYLIDFDEYQHEELYVVIGVIAFVLGAWSYLRSVTPRRRWLALLLGVTLAMLSMAVGKWIIVPSQDWPQWFQWHAPETERWFESIREIFAWGWIVLALSAPALLSLLPHAKETDLPPAQSQA